MSSKPEQHLKVGDWWYLPQQDKLVKFSAAGEITATADLDNLCQKAVNYFIVNAGRLITRDEILADVWGVRDVSDGRISRVIRVLRVALGDDSREPTYIETIPKRGFRFIAPVAEVMLAQGAELSTAAQEFTPPAVKPQQVAAKPRPSLLRNLGLISLAGCALLYLGWRYLYLPMQDNNIKPFARFDPISSMIGLEYNAAVSPDGRHIVYNHLLPDYETVELVLQNLENFETRVMLSGKDLLSGPTWSPDGQQIAYQRIVDEKQCEIRVITLDAGKTTLAKDELLTNCGAKSLGGRLSWSPDGAYLVYPHTPDGLQHSVLMLYPFAGGKQEQLTIPPQTSQGDFAVRFSKKGDQLAFIRDDGGSAGQIWLMDLASRSSRLLLQLSGSYPMNIDWYDNDRKIIYPTSSATMSVVDVSTGHNAVLFNTFDTVADTLVSQQGRIYSTVGQYRKTNILKVENPLFHQASATEQVFQSSRSENIAEMNPVEGGPAAVLTSRSGLPQIWLYYPDGRQQQISNFTESIISKGMEFSPDGRHLLANIGNEVWLFAEGEAPLKLTQSEQSARDPGWSHDGKYIYFSSSNNGRWQIMKVNISMLQQEVYASDLDYFKESPDGQYQVGRRISDGGYQLTRQDGTVVNLPVESAGFALPQMILRSQYLYFSQRIHENKTSILAYELQTGEVHDLKLEMNYSLKRFSVSINEKYVYSLQGTPGDMDIVEVKIPE
ncbi:winged helix-turn-helix domain-containing protein [Rheinheimera sp. 4Y26]|uniref:winged helix-turn-helix domain-containing protein n=1 Tax=Rheinheimera sp. 4Y26 TaxID=2977811 RepID=UPI0021B0D0AE|nr:winged helix-turn-helix domain-containing protein [Rheinheimera sp. 4Y26]MCT6698896.1 winged helix-turn-helix domain-containing protein [Rheinheimera sp. 4Y26]